MGLAFAERPGPRQAAGRPPAERRAQRQRNGAGEAAVRTRYRRPRDPSDVAALEPGDAVGEISRRVEAVRVHARDELSAGLEKRNVEAVRGTTGRIVEHANSRVACGEPLEPLAGVVARAALREQELDFPVVESLGQHRRHRAVEHRTLVEHGDQHADHGGVQPPPR